MEAGRLRRSGLAGQAEVIRGRTDGGGVWNFIVALLFKFVIVAHPQCVALRTCVNPSAHLYSCSYRSGVELTRLVGWNMNFSSLIQHHSFTSPAGP